MLVSIGVFQVMRSSFLRLNAASLCAVLLVSCGGGGGGSDEDAPPPAVTPGDLIGQWELEADPEAAEASGVERVVSMYIHDGGFDGEGPNGTLRVIISESFIDATNNTLLSSDRFFGELVLNEQNGLFARLNHIATDGSGSSQQTEATTFKRLSGVAVDGETLSFVVEATDKQERRERTTLFPNR